MMHAKAIVSSSRFPADENYNPGGYREQKPPLTRRDPAKLTPPTKSEQSNLERIKELASIALDHYNKGKDVKFELVEVLDYSTLRFRRYFWNHMGFNAKLCHAHTSSPSPHLFFAELKQALGQGSISVTCCRILDPTTDKVTRLCRYCKHDRVLHPADGMQVNQRISLILTPAMKQTQGEVEGGGTRSFLLLENHPLPPLDMESKGGGSCQNENFNYLAEKNQSSSTQRCKDPQGGRLLRPNNELMLKDSKHKVKTPCQKSGALTQSSIVNDHPDPWIFTESEIETYTRIAEERAKFALDYYNEEKNTEFELVEFKGSNCFWKTGHVWYHLNFEAKPKDSPHSDPYIKVFFGELFQEYPGSLRATCCRILDTLDKDTVFDDCGHCPRRLIVHPGDEMRISIRPQPFCHLWRGKPSDLWSVILQGKVDDIQPSKGTEYNNGMEKVYKHPTEEAISSMV